MILPDRFADLEPFVETWACGDFEARLDRRYRAEMSEILLFYEAMLPRADALLHALGDATPASLAGPELRAYRLLMSLAHCALAVERHKQPRAPYTQFPNGVRIKQGPVPA